MSEKSLAGTRTEVNLLKAFAGESQARNRYTLAAAIAKKEGYVAIERAFLETADQEHQHAKRFFSFLDGKKCLEITASFPAGLKETTLDNLKDAADGEHDEAFNLYPEFAKIAAEEGFPKIAACFNNIITAEKYHEKRYRKFIELLEKGYFKSEEPVMWRCINCGYVHLGKEAPKACPACLHPQKYFERVTNLFE